MHGFYEKPNSRISRERINWTFFTGREVRKGDRSDVVWGSDQPGKGKSSATASEKNNSRKKNFGEDLLQKGLRQKGALLSQNREGGVLERT